MKLQVTFKTPDAVRDATYESEEFQALSEEAQEKIEERYRTWFRYGEVVYLEYDTEADTLVVVKPKPRSY